MSNADQPTDARPESQSAPPKEEILEQLSRILRSDEFVNAGRLSQLLTFVVERALLGTEDAVSEYDVAFGVFGQPSSFDPDKNSIVRTNAKRLRLKLEGYYAASGKSDPILIDLTKGYLPKFSWRVVEVPDVPVLPVATDPPKVKTLPWWRWVLLAASMAFVIVTWLSWLRRPVGEHEVRLFA